MYNKVSEWLDEVLDTKVHSDVNAFCFNLYDDGDGDWSMELVGTSRFDVDDEDWACDEVSDFHTREKRLTWNTPTDWKDVLNEITENLTTYLNSGKYASLLKSKIGVGVGFVDGNINILYKQ